jgi:hypothetical protein
MNHKPLFTMLLSALLFIATDTLAPTPPNPPRQVQLSIQPQVGFIIPHAADLRAISQSTPVGVTLEYSRTSLSRAAYERCNCFARIGTYLSYTAFNNPAELGRTYGAGAFFEPLIRPAGRFGNRLFFSVRASAGLAWLTRVYNEQTNPRNTFFSAPLSGLLGLSAATHVRLSRHMEVSLWANYNHISNGGTRQPNRGMNFPTLGLGLTYLPQPQPFPDPTTWQSPRPQSHHTARLMAFGTVRVLPGEGTAQEQSTTLLGLTGTYGRRLSRFHAISGGLEVVRDGYMQASLQRQGQPGGAWLVSALAGYELWMGRYNFTAHLGGDLLRPDGFQAQRLFQRYQLLYTLGSSWQVGIGLKARLNVAEGFDVRLGRRF